MTEPTSPEQLELPLEFPTYDHYVVTISKGAIGDMEVVRTHQAKTEEEALNLVDGLRDSFGNRDNVTWREQEMTATGTMYGLAPGGVVYEIAVTPTLGTLS